MLLPGEPPEQPSDDLQGRLRAYEAEIEARIIASRRRVEEALEDIWSRSGSRPDSVSSFAGPRPFAQRVDLRDAQDLRAIDGIFIGEFRIAQHLPTGPLNYPTIYCETLDEFFEPVIESLDLSTTARQAMLQEMKARAEEIAARTGGGQFGMNIPGRGCYINGWLFAYRRAENARKALQDPAIYPRIVATVVHEKLGHGFLVEYTALGAEKKRCGLWRYDMAQRFNLRMTDTPAMALLVRKQSVIHQASQLMEEGWSTWLEHYMIVRMFPAIPAQSRPPEYGLPDLVSLLNKVSRLQDPVSEAAQAVRQSVQVLFAESDADAEAVHQAILGIHRFAPSLDERVSAELGQPLAYVLGYLLLRKLEASVGTLAVPYALLIAGNVEFGLDKVAVSDLVQTLVTDPRLNPDSRLALQTTLSLKRPGDLSELAGRAHEELSLAIPEALKRR